MINLDKKFEPLRNMDAFTDDMFNRIVAFQEKEHPAWQENLTFDQRISGLPLHNLIFSNPDRDPANHGPTVAPYYPLRWEMKKIAAYVNQLDSPTLLDWYPGNGFIGSLVAREGITVTGVGNHILKPNQINSFYDKDCFHFVESIEQRKKHPAILVSWPPPEYNPSKDLLASNPQLIVYIFTRHTDDNTGKRQTGCDKMLSDLGDQYKLIDEWTVTREKNILHEIWPDMTPSIEEIRYVHIFAQRNCQLSPVVNAAAHTVYDWEKDLLMATLALEAKQQLRAQGIRV